MKEREIIRKYFMRTSEEIEKKLNGELADEDMLSLLRQLNDKGDRLFSADENIRGMLLVGDVEEEKLDEEYSKVEFYREELIKLRVKCEVYLSAESQKITSHNGSNEKNKRNFHLPKIELKKFDGNVKNWIGFWGQFRKIHEDTEIDAEDKYQYLLQATEVDSPARELVESFPPSKANYALAIDQLKTRFAKDEFLIEVYVRELLGLVLKQAMDTTGMSLSSLYDKLETQLRALESLGVTKEKYAAMLFPLVESALPNDILKVWERYRSANKNKTIINSSTGNFNDIINGSDNLSLLLDFLRNEVESEKRINLAQSSFSKESSENKWTVCTRMNNESKLYTAAALHIAGSKEQTGTIGKKIPFCIFCNKSHLSQDCLKAQKLSLVERKSIVKDKKGCFICLKQFHNFKQCRAFLKCIVCSRKHYPIMCPDLENKKQKDDNENKNVENSLTSNLKTTVLLQTLLVKINFEGREKIVRTLLDSGSQRSYILSKTAQEMKLRKLQDESIIQGVFGGHQSQPEVHQLFQVNIKSLDDTYKYDVKILNQDRICNYLPRISDSTYLNYLKKHNIIIYDNSMSSVSYEIELLLGADIFGQLLTGKKHCLGDGLVAVETYLGWTIVGQYDSNNKNNAIFSGFSEFDISDLWDLELIGIKDSAQEKTKDILEEQVLAQFYQNIIVNKENRYEIKLPWTEDHLNILNNKALVLSRLQSNTKKLIDMGKFEDYSKVFNEWLKLGIIEEIIDKKALDQENFLHYLPHHAVIKESSETTKIRPVFDASARDKNNNSLNNCLEKGPNFLELIPSLIIKFRMNAIGVVSDIEKAFLQISVSPEDRDYLRFFWWKNYSQRETRLYRHCRVVFGVKSSPFILSATIGYHLDRVGVQFKETAEKLKNSFYVDNCVASVRNEVECKKFIENSTIVMSAGNFNLRGWIYNSLESEVTPEKIKIVGVLGLLWNVQDDTLFCDTNNLLDSETVLTKRHLLSVAQKIFDVIGFLCPVLLIPKLLLQETWQQNINWDQKLPSEILTKFQVWLKQIDLLSHCKIQRTLCNKSNLENSSDTTIHIFCDASKSAYASCIFLRTIIEEKILVSLVIAKSRIAPKNITLPRLELLATLLGVRLYKTVKNVREFSEIKTYFWSDSMVALTWIRTRGQWKMFVENRVREIRSITEINDWYHIPGKINPADLASRGCNAKTLLETKWWLGPTWLKENPNNWPYTEIVYTKEVDSEKIKNIQTFVSKSYNSTDFQYFSKYSQIIRMITWMLRFIHNCKRVSLKRYGTITHEECEEAENKLIRVIQEESFGNGENINLEKFKDDHKIWRVKTRLVLGEFEENFKYPILLPSQHVVVKRLIEEYHMKHYHAGVQTLLSILREKYWILKGRKTVRQVISKCTVCKRYTSKPLDTPFAPLPKERITCGRAFSVIGIDLAGPLYLKDKTKTWIVLFTCAVYRAIHLELVNTLSTESFLAALRRFSARRGRVSTIYSDNGSNFVGAFNAMRNIDWKKVIEYSSVNEIKWIFNAPTAAWWGGWWERLIRVVKDLLRKNLGKSTLNYEELLTLLCECEAVVNSRPLTYTYDDANNMKPLTPSMFICDIPRSDIPEFDEIGRNNLITRQRYLQALRDGLRMRFKKEYLAELVNSGQRRPRELAVDDIVLIEEENVKRSEWKMGKVLKIYPGRDGVARVAKVKTKIGELVRPLQRLYPMEVETTDALNKNKQRLNSSRDCYEGTNEESLSNGEDSKDCQEITNEEEVKAKKEQIVTRRGRVVKKPERYGVI